MQVHLLGPVTVVVDGAPIDLGGARNRALVARLALAAPHAVATEVLVDDLWGDDPPKNAHNALQSVVSRTRSRLPEGTLASNGSGYRLAVETDDVDAHRFTRLAREGRGRDALATWRGRALEGLDDAPFVQPAVTALEERRLVVLEDSIEADVAGGRYDAAALVAELTSLVDAHPYRERLWTALMRVLAATGRTADALAAYERLRERLADDLGLDPTPAAQELQQRILVGDIGPGPGAVERPRTNLRLALTSFVGRDRALAELADLMSAHRLVTLVGPGGAGKTRLAVETASHLATRFPDGVWIVELASVTDPDDILDAVVAALDLREVVVLDRPTERRADDRTRLIEALTARRALIVMDNCEHLVADVAGVTEDLLQALPDLRVVATSREPLDLTGEVILPVASLELPAEGTSPSEALGYSAVDLFVQRARAASPAFELDEATLPSVLEICRRLDGQPLALELAAARLRSLTAPQVAARLGDRFRLLTGGSRTALPRHRTLRAVVEWSWDLLDDTERTLAERAAVFPGGISVPAAAAVADSDELAALDLLTALADKSLLVPATDRLGEPRFRMLETLREYGIDQLVEHGAADSVRRAHLRYFGELAHTMEPRLRTRDQLDALAVYDDERGNLLAALRYAIEVGDAATATTMVSDLAWYFSLRSQHEDIAEWASRALTVPGPKPPTAELLCTALHFLGLFERGDDSAERNAVVARFEELRADPGIDRDHPLVALVQLAADLFGAPPGTEATQSAGMRAVAASSDPWVRSAALFLGVAWRQNAGVPCDDAPVMAEALAGFREAGDRWGEAMVVSGQAAMHEVRGEFADARARLNDAIALMRELGADEDAMQLATRDVTLVARDLEGRDLAEVRAELARILAEAEKHGRIETLTLIRVMDAEVEHELGDAAEAVRKASAVIGSLDDPGVLRSPQIRAVAYVSAARCLRDTDPPRAADCLERAAYEARRSRDMPIAAMVATGYAVRAMSEGDLELAAQRLGAARQIRGGEDLSNVDGRELSRQLPALLGEERYEELYAEGAAMAREDALDLALPAAAS